ncbi:helix-turn-helix domain-containing protein [Streptomyces cinnamoneus]|uniref:Transcriptional regulator n=1 Tax=Streptomyces cinnamoneus TaxID=53446 RepID=A0A918TM30_STRCJ|nr:helix-turn-helix transcriptional regulator [Streptomyces cinnamoneus]GHC53817.1 transcriptional regulator [Streptomyces cinnamoneus]
MTQSRNTDPYSDPRAFYGSELCRLRSEAGLTQAQLGERVFCSGSYIGQFETMLRLPQLELSQLMDDVLGSGQHLQRLCRLARKAKGFADYAVDALDLEPRAKAISEYSPVLVPGLLQTEGYAHAITSTAQPFAASGTVEHYVQARMERQRLLDDPSHPMLTSVLQESVLRSHIGGSTVMRQQIQHLIEMAQRTRVVIQVLPFTAMSEAFMDSMVSLMNFCDSPPVVYTEGGQTGRLIEEPGLVEHNGRLYDLVRTAALSRAASLEFFESMAKEYATL